MISLRVFLTTNKQPSSWQHAVLIYAITIFPAIIDLHSWILIKWKYNYLFTLTRDPSTWFPSVMSSSKLDELSVILSWSTTPIGSSCTSCKQQKARLFLIQEGVINLGLGTRADIGECLAIVTSRSRRPGKVWMKVNKMLVVQILSNSRANHFYN